MKRGADLVAEGLLQAGVRTIFTLSGNQIMPIFDALLDGGISLIHVRHEAAAVFMADAWSQLNSEIGVALLTAGPGFANGMGALYSARCAESAVLVLSGDSPVAQDGMGAFQELDQTKISAPLTKLSLRSMQTQHIPADLFQAIHVATSGRPGPVHLAFPHDILQKKIAPAEISSLPTYPQPPPPISEKHIAALKQELARAKCPLILTGPALSPTRIGDWHEKLLENLACPVVNMESPRGLKDPALGNFHHVLQEADRVLVLGKAIDHTLSFARTPPFHPKGRFLVVDPDPAFLQQAQRALGERLAWSEQIADLKTLIKMLASGSKVAPNESWNQRVQECVAARSVLPPHASQNPMHPATLCLAVQDFLAQSSAAIFVGDGGEFGQWAQASISAPKRIINGVSGAIGGGLCYALAAKASFPEATVVALMGDGTAGFHLSEFETAVRYQIPILAVIGHDARWNAEVQIQLRDYGAARQFACELAETRYDLAVQGLGGYGEWVTHPSQLAGALQRAVESGLPACINVPIASLPAPSGSH